MPINMHKDLETHKSEVLADINNKSAAFILEKYPQHKQNNMSAKFMGFLSRGSTRNTECDDIQKSWKWIQDVVDESNIAHSSVVASTSVEEMYNIINTFHNNLLTIDE